MAMSGKIQIRMYNVGFGDCFLLILPTKHTILVDAGFHSSGAGPFSGDALVTQIIDDVTTATGQARIDVVIATHRHQDHVFAFNSTKWNGASVGEVWLPWVENRKSAEAKSLWKKKDGFAFRLAAALPTFNLSAADRDDINFMLWNAGVDIPGMGFAAWSNVGALNTLHGGFASRDRERPRYLPRTKTFPESFQPAVLPGVRVHVLGPARDPDFIEELDPEADGETYRTLALRAAKAAAKVGGPALPVPFGPRWEVPKKERGFTLRSEEVQRMVQLAQSADAMAAAEQLDDMINSTSLVLVLQIGTARLLLPGDAEWGTWKRILKNDDAKTLLKGSTFFKVGHHGSHNATSKTLVERVLPQNIPAMISTQQGGGNWRKNIPLTELLGALDLRGIQHVRSDSTGALPAGFTRGAQWIDLDLAC
jgi:beta-lactamase superfamily II metal-dependent hydrolase